MISIFVASDWYWPVVFSPVGVNCLEDHIIETESDCKFAAERRDSLSYVGNVTNNLYPAGCFWNNYKAYFNNIIDPSKTDPEGNRGGICWRKRIYLVSIMWKIFSNHFNFFKDCYRLIIFFNRHIEKRFEVTKFAENCSDIGKETLDSISECKEAAKEMNAAYMKDINLQNCPKACVATSPEYVFWNNNEMGDRNIECQAICRKSGKYSKEATA